MLKNLKSRKSLIIFFVFALAFFLRTIFLPSNSLTFGYDQARDAIISLQIANGDLKILGPSASTPGLYHGVFYYYIIAPAYSLGQGNPIVTAYFISFINASVIFLIFYFGIKIFNNFKLGLLAALVFAVSFESTQYATWLSNPTIGIFTVPLIYIGLWGFLFKKSKIAALLLGIGLGLSTQAEIFLIYHLLPVLIWSYLYKKNIVFKNLIISIVSFVISISTMIAVEFKFGFKSIAGITSLLNERTPVGLEKSLGDTFILYLNQLGRMIAYSTYPKNIWIGAMLFIISFIIAIFLSEKENRKKLLFLLTWILSHMSVVSVGGDSTPFLLVGIAPAVCLAWGYILSSLFNTKKLAAVLILLIICYGNVSMIMKENQKGQTIFAIQKDMLLSKQLAAIDYTYQSSQNEVFSVNSLTSPLWINIVWSYLYKWYGNKVYGFVPEFHGKNQIGTIDSLQSVTANTKNYYLILEPLAGIPRRYLDETIGEEDTKSALVEEKSFGELIIQKRIKTKSK